MYRLYGQLYFGGMLVNDWPLAEFTTRELAESYAEKSTRNPGYEILEFTRDSLLNGYEGWTIKKVLPIPVNPKLEEN